MTPAEKRLPLACTVRECFRPLERQDQALVCAVGHSFDISRSGYINLLQPQDRRSRDAGDSKSAIEARAELLASGIGRAIIDAVARRSAALDLPEHAVVVDLGSGSGDGLAAVAGPKGPALRGAADPIGPALGGAGPIAGIGIDLSAAAAEHAARRFPSLTWVVANADRRLPLLDRSIDLVLSMHGRRNPGEVARVLVVGGHLLIALPAPDDLIELRTLVQGERVERSRGDAMLAEHESHFDLLERSVIRETLEVERDDLLKLLRGTYRGERHASGARVAHLARMRVTLASELCVFRLR